MGTKNRTAVGIFRGMGVTFALILLFSACYGAPNKIDACKLISATEAGKILGKKVTVKPVDTSAAGQDAGSLCSYRTGKVSGGFLLIAGHVKYSSAVQEVVAQKKTAGNDVPPGIPKPTFGDIMGLGEAAYLLKAPGSFQVHVLAHQKAIVVNMNRNADARSIALAEKIARIALDNLEGGKSQ